MKQMKTSMVALVVFVVYVIYGAFRIPYMQYIVALLAGAIGYGMTKSYEIGLIALLSVNFLYGLVLLSFKKAGFVDGPKEISGRIRGMLNPGVGTIQGFADISGNDGMAPDTAPSTEVATAKSEPAPIAKQAKEEKQSNDGFQADNGLFKLGRLPTESKGGTYVDTGSTISNALKSLKPEQIKEMTRDTQQLLETQKNLMEMLKTFAPMISEGKEMMNTFNGMFGPSSGAGSAGSAGGGANA
jgi:hypothetical protein